MTDFHQNERRVLDALYAAEKPLSTQKVADMADMSWPTADKYLNRLREKEFVTAGKLSKTTYWWLQT